MEGKKISFGFFKTKKVEKPVIEEKKEFIECIDDKAIKVIGGETVQENKPLVIPMKPNTLITAERLKEIAEKVEKDLEEPVKVEIKTEENLPENETIEQMAVRELLQEAKKEVNVDTPSLTVPVTAKPVLDARESTLDDYETVPIQDFGLAMLRGMGWTPNKDQSKYKQPELRPKGLGLGADKVIKENQKKKSNNDKEEELAIVKNSYVKITTGKYSGCYGKVLSLDEDNGRVMIDIPIKKETVNLSEFMMQAVTKSEYDKESKVINADSYEQYKRDEKLEKNKRDPSKNSIKDGSPSQKYENRSNTERRGFEESSNGRNKQRSRRDSSSSERRHKKKDKNRYSSSESISSVSDNERRKKHRKKKQSNSDSEDYRSERRRRSRSAEGKRDIDKKRKGKKKKRDRDRSPNYKKHRK